MPAKLTQEEFIKKAEAIHVDENGKPKYSYDKVVYVKNNSKVKIICPIHGEFEQIPFTHLDGSGCSNCGKISTGLKKRSDLKSFILQAEKIHYKKYDYKKSIYVKNNEKLIITCPEHGDFLQKPNLHLNGNGCSKCSNHFTYTTKEFVERSKNIHLNEDGSPKYNYGKTIYVNSYSYVNIICPKHGLFRQVAGSHLRGHICSKCSNEKQFVNNVLRKKIEQFLLDANKIHNYKYRYNSTIYVNSKTKIKIICPIHGEFEQIPNVHLNGGGCPDCGGVKRYSTEEFIAKSVIKHNFRYDYSKVNYINAFKKINIICPEHGLFKQKPSLHLFGHACPKCSSIINGLRKRLTHNSFIQRCNLVHNYKYTYKDTIYQGGTKKINIICPEHGLFKQAADCHLSGQGCPKCGSKYNLSELKLYDLILSKIESVEHQARPIWLKTKKTSRQSLDIYLPDYNIAIEYQGKQHFHPINFFGGEKAFKANQLRDERKRKLCEENGCKLFYFSYDITYVPVDYPYEVYFDELELVNLIKEHIASKELKVV